MTFPQYRSASSDTGTMSNPFQKKRWGPPLVKLEEGVEDNQRPDKVQRVEQGPPTPVPRVSSNPILDNTIPDAVSSSESPGPLDQKEVESASLKQQLEKKRAKLAAEEKAYWTAREHEMTVDHTVSTLTSKRKELKLELGLVRDQLALGKEEQQRASVSTQECLAKKTQTQAEFDSLLAELLDENNGALEVSVRVPRKQSLRGNDDSEFHTGFQLPMYHSSRASYPDSNTSGGNKKTSDNDEGKPLSPTTREDLFALVHQAAKEDEESNQDAKATLIGWVNKVSLAKLRKVFKLPSQNRTFAVSQNRITEVLRVLHYGNFQHRKDFCRKDNAWKSRVLGAKGKVIIRSDTTRQMQVRLIEMLEIPE